MKNKGILLIFSTITIGLIFSLIYAGYTIWSSYKDDIIYEQKNRLQLISDSVSQSFSEMLLAQVNSFNFISDEINIKSDANINEITDFLSLYKQNNSNYITDIFISNSEPSLNDSSFSSYNLKNDITLTEYVDDNQNAYFKLSKELSNGMFLNMLIDMTAFYNNVIAHMQIGDSGYLVVKNANGIILMHPASIQIGQHLIEGRAQVYGDVDLTSLEELFNKQKVNQNGVFEYYSYWWLSEELIETQKISAHTQIQIGNSFIIVSAVIDYNEITMPIYESLQSVVFIFILILFIILLFALFTAKLISKSKKDTEEIQYLKSLNLILDENKKLEENINHQQRLQTIGTMTSGIGHEFNNMLTPIIGYAELLKSSYKNSFEQNEYLDEILISCSNAKDIINQISTLGKKGSDWDFDYIKASKAISSFLKIIHSICPRNIEFEFTDNLNSDVGFLGNETQINQVILNIFVNATHAFNSYNDAKISMTTSVVSIEELEYFHNTKLTPIWNEYIQIKISDNGIGISEDILNQIFDPFFTTKTNGQGLGLGLSLTQQIVFSHNGYIMLNSKETVGSDFYVYLPLAKFNTSPKIAENDRFNILMLSSNEKSENTYSKYNSNFFFANSLDKANKILFSTHMDYILIDNNFLLELQDNAALKYAYSIRFMYPYTQKIIITSKLNKDILLAQKRGCINDYANDYNDFLAKLHNTN